MRHWRRILLLLLVVMTSSCSSFESFHLRLPFEIAYGDKAVQADQAVEVAQAEARRDVLLQANEPHTVNVQFPASGGVDNPGDPTVAGTETPPPVVKTTADTSAPLAVTAEGIVLYDCVPTKGGLVECRGELD